MKRIITYAQVDHAAIHYIYQPKTIKPKPIIGLLPLTALNQKPLCCFKFWICNLIELYISPADKWVNNSREGQRQGQLSIKKTLKGNHAIVIHISSQSSLTIQGSTVTEQSNLPHF